MTDNRIIDDVEQVFRDSDVKAAVLEHNENGLTMLISEEQIDLSQELLKQNGWKMQKDRTGDSFLYGMMPFRYYSNRTGRLILCCQLACRSSWNRAWLPLDRRINSGDLLQKNGNAVFAQIPHEDMLCYLLAKGVYTDGVFSSIDAERINQELIMSNESILMPKLEAVFFKFSNRILEMSKKGEYSKIKEALLAFSDY